ncbi:MAG: hypothetical protein ACREBD_11020 [Blastocatellia bacterium]
MSRRLKPAVKSFKLGRKRLSARSANHILSVHDSEQLVREVLEAGARGYVLKSDAGRDLIAAVESLCQHKPFFTARVSEIRR